jgi:hypothetical protein
MCDIICGRSSDLVHSFMSLDKDRELVEAQAEVKALKLSERLKTKAVEEVRSLAFSAMASLCVLHLRRAFMCL